jgi:phosphoglycerol transferase MdoB-like AlkP superfamily enzyme
MSNVISLDTRKPVDVFNGRLVTQPTYGYQYLLICKEHLTTEDYEEVLLSIMDEDYYKQADDQLKAIVDEYFTFDK